MTARFFIDGIIGWNIEFSELFAFFESNKDADSYHLIINSPGGLVDEGRNMYDLIKSQSKPVTTEIYAAHSIASVVALAGSTRIIRENGEMLVHLPWIDPGPINEGDLERLKESFSKAKNQIINIYSFETGKDRDELEALMASEKVLSAEEAIAWGFATGYAKGEVSALKAEFNGPVMAFRETGITRGNMANMKDEILAGVKALFEKKEEPQALKIALDSGLFLEIRTSDTAAKVGDAVTINSEKPEDGQYLSAQEGISYQIEGGKIAAIEKPELIQAAQVGQYIVEAVTVVHDKFQGQVEAMNAKITEALALLKDTAAALEVSKTEVQELRAELDSAKEGKASTYTPPKADGIEGNEKKEARPVNIYAGVHNAKQELRKKDRR